MVSSVSDSVTHLEHKITRFQLAADPPDLLLEPAVFGIGLFDFHRAEAVIGAGCEAVLDDTGLILTPVADLKVILQKPW